VACCAFTTNSSYSTMIFESSEPDAQPVIENAERELMDRVLPSIGAGNLVETEPFER
jgi:hypothetical protein